MQRRNGALLRKGRTPATGGALGLVDQPGNSCSGVNRVLDEHIAHVDVRIRELHLLKEQLVALRETCHSEQSVVDCGIVQGLRSMETESKHARQTHLG